MLLRSCWPSDCSLRDIATIMKGRIAHHRVLSSWRTPTSSHRSEESAGVRRRYSVKLPLRLCGLHTISFKKCAQNYSRCERKHNGCETMAIALSPAGQDYCPALAAPLRSSCRAALPSPHRFRLHTQPQVLCVHTGWSTHHSLSPPGARSLGWGPSLRSTLTAQARTSLRSAFLVNSLRWGHSLVRACPPPSLLNSLRFVAPAQSLANAIASPRTSCCCLACVDRKSLPAQPSLKTMAQPRQA